MPPTSTPWRDSPSSSGNSEPPSPRAPRTYEELLGKRESLLRLRDLADSRLWEALADLWRAERLRLMERLLEATDDADARDSRTIARWIGWWLEAMPAEIKAAVEREENPQSPGLEGGTPWMESDGESAESRTDVEGALDNL